MRPINLRRPLAALFPSLLLVIALGCDSTSKPGTEKNLITNGSFEKKGRPSLYGWELLNPSLCKLENEGGPGGGAWSIRLSADWAPTTAVVWQRVDGVTSGDVLTLSAYIRAVDPDGGGILKLLCGPEPQSLRGGRSVMSDSTHWVKVTVTDTLSLSEGDFVWAVLSSHHTEISKREGLFDEVRLVREAAVDKPLD